MKKLVACLLSVATMVATLYTPAFAYEGQPLGRNVAYNRTVKVSNSFIISSTSSGFTAINNPPDVCGSNNISSIAKSYILNKTLS